MVLDVSAAVLAFHVGGTTIKAEVLANDLSSLASTSVPTPRGPALVDALVDVAATLLDCLRAEIRTTVRAAGLAIPGIVDAERGTVVYAASVGLRDTPIPGPLSDRISLPVALGHHVTASDAERRHGAAADVVDPVVVAVGTGIAAVSFAHGHRVTGVSGQACELGHVVVRPDGPVCGCGARGCLEAVASASAVARRYRELSGREVEGAREVVARLGVDPGGRPGVAGGGRRARGRPVHHRRAAGSGGSRTRRRARRGGDHTARSAPEADALGGTGPDRPAAAPRRARHAGRGSWAPDCSRWTCTRVARHHSARRAGCRS